MVVVWHLRQKILQVCKYIQFIESGTFYQGIEYRICLCSLWSICKQPGSSCCGEGFDIGFAQIIADRKAAVFHKCFQIFFLVCSVGKCLGQHLICGMHSGCGFHPRPKGIKDRAGRLLTLLFLFLRGKAFYVFFHLKQQIDIFTAFCAFGAGDFPSMAVQRDAFYKVASAV